MSIQIKQVSKFYGEQKALDSVSFEVNNSEILGFIGPNGAGKSTLMKIITGYLPPSEGSVEVNGFDPALQPLELKRCIGYLPENNPLYLYMYVEEYLRFFAGVHKLGRNTDKRIAEIVEMTGLSPEKHKKIGALSKGYRQRVGLAQALLHDPKVLILDEPTTGLDPNQIVEIRNLISEIGREKTVMLSTHIMQEVEAICHRVIIINKGIIVANDTAGNLSANNSENHIVVLTEFDKLADEAKLAGLEGVLSVKHIEGNSYQIETGTDFDIRPVLFHFAVDHQLTVLSMQRQEQHLEEVFRRVTH
jgi:ABC-2 type transport system ATP-binding protein